MDAVSGEDSAQVINHSDARGDQYESDGVLDIGEDQQSSRPTFAPGTEIILNAMVIHDESDRDESGLSSSFDGTFAYMFPQFFSFVSC
jgi:hypothetical protein